MSTLLFLAGVALCGAAGWFGATKMKLIEFIVLLIMLFAGNSLIEVALK